MVDYTLSFQTVSIPTGAGGITLTVEEDDNSDGTVDTTEQVTLSDGVTSYTTNSGAFAGSGQVRLSWSIGPPSDVTTTSATVVPADVTLSQTAPNAPSTLAATQGSEDQLSLSWTDNSDNEDGFYVYRAQSTGSTTSDYTQVADLAANTTTYTDTGLNDGSAYYYRVSAYNSVGESPLSNEDSATTVLPPASNLATSGITDTSVDLSWTVNSDTGTQSVEYKESTASTWTTFSTGLALSTSTETVTGLSPGTSYDFRVGTTTADAGPVYSNTASATTTAPPNTPQALTVDEVAGTPSVSLSWGDVSTEDEYRIYRSTSPGSTLADYTQIATVTANTTTYTDTTVSLGTRYYYRVSAWNTSGESSASNEVRAEPNTDEFTESVAWDSEAEWGYGGFSDTLTTDGAGTVELAARNSATFDYSLQNEGLSDSTAEIRDADTTTVLASAVASQGDNESGQFVIDTTTHPNLEFEVTTNPDTNDNPSNANISWQGETIVSAAGGSSDTATRTFQYEDTGTWTSPYWDYTNTTTATRLAWSGVTLPNTGDDVTVTVENSDGTSTAAQSLSPGSGEALLEIAADDQYRLSVDVTTGDPASTPSIDAVALEAHTPTTGQTVTDTRNMEVDLSWNPIAVCDGYQVLYSESTPVTASDAVGFENADSASTSGTVSGLKQGATYYFNVRPKYTGE